MALFNNFSKRKVGDDFLLGRRSPCQGISRLLRTLRQSQLGWPQAEFHHCHNQKRQRTAHGFALHQSRSFQIRRVAAIIDRLYAASFRQSLPDQLFKEDWREKISLFVQEYLTATGKQLKSLTKEDKRQLALQLHAEGAFRVKHAASYVGDVVDISRARVYNYLGEKR